MKKYIFLFAFLLGNLGLKAGGEDEGMWIPMLIGQLNEADMKARGMKLSAEDLYSVNKSSLKDAVVSFGGFCTGEVISDQGLLLTNHHCGYGQIQYHSSPERDMLTDGYWAMNRAEELPNPGLTATFIVRIEDVTGKVLDEISPDLSQSERDVKIRANIKRVEQDAIEGSEYGAKIKPFFYGNEYYLFVTETFRDVRLVGAPPSSVGKYGADTDNWMWPRHTGDFSVFRIYANKDNKPADYSEDNVPYKPKHHFPISLKGVEKGDFTMVYGFPGRTQEYLTSYAIDQIQNLSNPHKIAVREEVLEIMNTAMTLSTEMRIKYAAKQSRVSNYWKKWIGENRGLKKLNAIETKGETEKKFQQWADKNPDRKAMYGGLLPRFKKIYEDMAPMTLARDYINESVFRPDIMNFAYYMTRLEKMSNNEETTDEAIKEEAKSLKKRLGGVYKDFDADTDEKILAVTIGLYEKNVDKSLQPQVLKDLASKYGRDWNKWAAWAFDKSILASQDKVMDFLDGYTRKSAKKLAKDPIYSFMSKTLTHFRANISPKYYALSDEVNFLNRTYVKGLREMSPNKKFYPDANSTLRITFGQVDDYEPRDGVRYKPFTTIDGVIAKYVPGDREFDLPAKYLELYKNRDFGQYADNGTLPVCFTASNHTTGGNSGSPVLDAEGNLIGTNFDRNWEGTMSDIMYDPDRVRNISVDIRYTLWVIDKLGGAGHLIKELTLKR